MCSLPTLLQSLAMYFIALFILFRAIAAAPLPALITRYHTAAAVTSTEYTTTGTTTIWLPPVEIFISNGVTYTFTQSQGQWATTPVTTTSYYQDQVAPPSAAPTANNNNNNNNGNAESSGTTWVLTTVTASGPTTMTTSTTVVGTPAPSAQPNASSSNGPSQKSSLNSPQQNSQLTSPQQNSQLNSPQLNSQLNSPQQKSLLNAPQQNTPLTAPNGPGPETSSLSTQLVQPTTTSIATSTTQNSTPATSATGISFSTGTHGEDKFSQASVKLSAPKLIVYSPYNPDLSCKDYNTVQGDLQYIKNLGISHIRLYGVDCNVVSAVLPLSKQLGFTVNQGLWISNAGVDSIDLSVSALIGYGKQNGWDLFDVVTVGNEAINDGFALVLDLVLKIALVKLQLNGAGYTGAITTSEPPISFINNPALCDAAIDFTGVNVHSYFNTNLYASEAGSYVAQQQSEVAKFCNKPCKVTETGYPSQGNQNGNNQPSLANQYAAVKLIVESTGGDVTILSTFDDFWKTPGSYGVEQSFGCLGFF